MKIILTGGLGGIGQMIVEALKNEHEIIIIDVKEDKEKNAHKVDITDYKQVEDFFKKTRDFDVLINCAGILGPVTNLENSDMNSWQKTIMVNLIGTVNCCKAAIPILKNKKSSKIINIAGGGSAFPRIYHSAYAVSKAAAVRFTENLAKDFLHDKINIDVNIIAPGVYKTNMWKDESFDSEPEQWSDPKLLIDLVHYLLSEKSKGISGKFIHVKDPYTKFDKNTSSSELFTLRRIDDFKFIPK